MNYKKFFKDFRPECIGLVSCNTLAAVYIVFIIFADIVMTDKKIVIAVMVGYILVSVTVFVALIRAARKYSK